MFWISLFISMLVALEAQSRPPGQAFLFKEEEETKLSWNLNPSHPDLLT